MLRRLPIWFQALALIALSVILFGTVSWLRAREASRRGSFETDVYNLAYLMALAVAYLAVRFFFRFRDIEARESAGEDFLYRMGLAFVFAALLYLVIWFSPVNRVREAWAAGPKKTAAQVFCNRSSKNPLP